MSKIEIKVTIQNEETNSQYKTQAILQENLLKYKEDNNTTVTYNYKENILLRENSDLKMNYSFSRGKKSIGNIIIKDIDRQIPIEIMTKNLEKKKNNLLVEFSIEEKPFIYKIEEII